METTGHITNIYTSVKPVPRISKVFVFTRFVIGKESACRSNILRHRLLKIFLLLIMTGGLISSSCYNINLFIQSPLNIPEKIKITFILNDIFLKLTNVIILIMKIYFNKRDITRIFRKLKNADKVIDRRSRIDLHTRTRLFSLRQKIVLIFVFILLYSCNYFFVYKDEKTSVLQALVDNLCYTINIFMVLQYVTLVRMVSQRYKHINNRITEYSETESSVRTSLKTYRISTSVNKFCNEKCDLSNLTCPQVKSEVCGIPMLRLAYIDLYDTVTLVNSHFGIPILFLIISLMIVCVTAFYLGLYSFGSASDTHFKTCMLVFSVLFYAVPFAWLIVSCDNTMQEANRGMVYIQRTTACPNMKYGTKLQLQSLSNQLRDMRVEFTACGFFVLNLPLLGTIVCGMVTYILIMIQLE
jgi:ABC-type multidrug transport system fused ATPase/permease subunit